MPSTRIPQQASRPDDIEMTISDSTHNNNTPALYPEDDSEGENTSSLPPPDKGRQAWIILAGCTLIQAPVWGYTLAFGVIQDWLTTHAEFEGGAEAIASIGTTANGVMYLSSPLTFYLLTRWPQLRQWCGPLGLVLATGAFLLSSFATTIWQLIVLQGVLSSLGSGLLFTPTTLYLDEWFVRRKGFAVGMMWSGKSLFGAAIPFIVSATLERYGFRTLIRAWAIVLFLISAPLLPMMKPRIPVSSTRAARPLSWAFLRSPSFWALQAGNIGQSLGYFLPLTYLPVYCARVGLSSVTGTLAIALISGASTAGSLIFGPLIDKWSVATVVALCAGGSALAVFLLWGLSGAVGPVVAFSLAYGFFAGSYSTTWGGMTKELSRADASLDTGLVFGMFAGGRGVGNVISGPLSSALIASAWAPKLFASSASLGGYATEYGPLILFTGATAVLGGCGFTQRWMRPRV